MADSIEYGKSIISKGIDQFAVGLGDNMINMSNSLNLAADSKTTTEILLFKMGTFTYNPFQDPTVRDIFSKSVGIYILCLMVFILLGGAYLQISRAGAYRNRLVGQQVENHMTLSEFAITVFGLNVVIPVVPLLMWLVLLANYVFSSMLMSGIIESAVPTPDNTVLYLGLALVSLLLAFVFVYRTLIIGIGVAFCLVIALFVGIPLTRRLGCYMFLYFAIMAFLQPIILGFTLVGIGIIDFLLWFNVSSVLFGYLTLGILLFLLSVLIILLPPLFLVLSFIGTKNVVKIGALL